MNKNFQVVHLSTSHKGGAGIAARRLNSELNRIGIKSSFYSIERNDFDENFSEFSIKRNLRQRILSFFSTRLGQLTLNTTFFSVFSSAGLTNKQLKSLAESENSILHLHNWFNLLTFSQLKRLILSGVPIVISMHDQRLMTGGCHVTLDCEQFKSGCCSCPRINSLLKSRVRRNAKFFEHIFSRTLPNLQIIAPSNFMIEAASKSQILKNQNLVFSPNPIPQEFFAYGNLKDHVPSEMFRVGVASANPAEPLKGGDLIAELSEIIEEDFHGVQIVYLADFERENYRDFWRQIDCILVPSRGDNSPNVIHEAKGFFIPVIASSVGGITELLHPEFDIELNNNTISSKKILESILYLKSRMSSPSEILDMHETYNEYINHPLNKIVDVYDYLFNTRRKEL